MRCCRPTSDRGALGVPAGGGQIPSDGHSAGVFKFCSGLVDLVVCVGRHGGGGHRLTLAG